MWRSTLRLIVSIGVVRFHSALISINIPLFTWIASQFEFTVYIIQKIIIALIRRPASQWTKFVKQFLVQQGCIVTSSLHRVVILSDVLCRFDRCFKLVKILRSQTISSAVGYCSCLEASKVGLVAVSVSSEWTSENYSQICISVVPFIIICGEEIQVSVLFLSEPHLVNNEVVHVLKETLR